uniref:Uncharacterized protein n=1 Tax=Siphoviridae sp. ctWT735 TaxID=2825538 RepID=A0A8S5TUA9_9CAUD|nr:MAG TPA: hypothetical protein [Siphoviridae sp. ctWT735]DAT98637.1 MAG TPA: hypothetical protein [Caudoviricetes sp.]
MFVIFVALLLIAFIIAWNILKMGLIFALYAFLLLLVFFALLCLL